MARFKCGECREITMLVPELNICQSCFQEKFTEIVPTLSDSQKRKLILIFRSQNGMENYAEQLLANWWENVDYSTEK